MQALEGLLISFQYTGTYSVALFFFAAYPIISSLVWITTSLFFVFRWERDEPGAAAPDRSFAPPVSILIPAHNEDAVIARSLVAVCAVDYPDYEIVVVNDGSSDGTVRQVLPFVQTGRVRLIDKRINEGKAMALNDALPMLRGDIVLIMDADAEPEPDILWHLVPHFQSARVAAVTGNPRVRNADNFLSRLQAIEFTSIVSLLRRSQRIWGRIVTVSGVVAAFRKSAVQSVGGFSPDMPTEDIELTWKLQRHFHDIRYEPHAIVWMTVPTHFRALFRQRLRWARGLMQVLRRHRDVILHWRYRRMWPMLIESVLSICWAIVFVAMTALWIASWAIGFPPVGASPLPNLWGMAIATLCLIQLALGTLIDHRYDRGIWRYFPYAVFYPLVYWAFLAITTCMSLHHLFVAPARQSITWNTPRTGREA
ncbi:glycosyltransferase [Methyloversatilis sp. XJ19-49]|uniref:glycosyltransferase n=1 Tax=Methyloversatilis sp. XJ19-49 TaxID=2963429 RepID=UPI00211B92DD|nr:glycosyltransferase [Methyloversatilis sp. XJ19-49]MCQ9376869.1 glycosyltransferase [Methyloversatilis sp. XJ19-49]